jgi:hypothetical protein
MPTFDYKNAAGNRIPGNTTVIGQNCGWGKQALMYWAWDQGRNGKDFRETRDDAATAGTLCHAMIETDIKNLLPIDTSKFDPVIVTKAETGLLNYLEWKLGIRLELKTMEVSLISERYQYGTTLDIVASANDKTSIVEVKTSNSIREDYLIQIAAQKQAWDENFPNDPIKGMHLLKVNKESGAFAHFYWDELDGAFDAFVHLRALHDLKKKLSGCL